MTVVTGLFLGTGALLIALSIPLLRRRVKPNDTYGLRVAATLENEAVWYEANARSARHLLLLGVVIAVLSIALPYGTDLSEGAIGGWLSGVLLAGAITSGVAGWRLANKLADELRNRGREA